MAIDSVNSAAPIITGATIGAAVGGAATWKGAPVVAKKFAEAQDTFVRNAAKNYVEKNSLTYNKLMQEAASKESIEAFAKNNNLDVKAAYKKISSSARAIFKAPAKGEALKEFIGKHKILNKVVEFTKTHKKSTIAIGAAAVAVVGGIIGKVIADKKAE